jgi:radical SAM superfamily enzyme YgiQ (UPF0313 family)
MKAIVHLVSLPWAPVLQPSVALGCLKAYIDMYFNGQVKCHTYSAFLEVSVNALGDNFLKFLDPKYCDRMAETVSEIVYFEEFKKNNLNKTHRKDAVNRVKAQENLFSLAIAGKLRSSLINYIDNRIIPNLEDNSINIIGLSMCIQQCYFSAFVGKYLKENCQDFNLLFLYGGSSADSINVAQVFAEEKIPGYFVIGEGEAKLVRIIETVMEADFWSNETEKQIEQKTVGVLPISKRILLYERNEDFYKTQLDLDTLPDPDYKEYFDTVKRICKDSDAYNDFIQMIHIPLEGSRGCFGNCDFCNNDMVWDGFRRFSQKRVIANALNYSSKYNCNKIFFVDNVCDTWAPDYAKELVERGRHITSSMELRADHSETFWTSMALSGLKIALIGTEALSTHLLKVMDKGTTVVQNIITQKCLKELEVKSVANIMANHPKSTIDDIKYTKNVVEHLPHLDQYIITYFTLVQGSPLYQDLSASERRRLKIGRIIPSDGSYRKLSISDFFITPEKWLNVNVDKAWSEYSKWHEERMKKLLKEPENIDVIECSNDMLWIRKISGGKQKDFKYTGKYSKVYEICHKGLSLERISSESGFAAKDVVEILNDFKAEKLMLDIEGIFVSLALRSRDVLIGNYLKSRQK